MYYGRHANISIPLKEEGWYHLDLKNIDAFKIYPEYFGNDVMKLEMLQVLSDVRYLLIRAYYDFNQIDGRYI